MKHRFNNCIILFNKGLFKINYKIYILIIYLLGGLMTVPVMKVVG